MLAQLGGGPTESLTKCWSTAVKDVWGLPRSTHTVYTRWLSCGHTSLQEDLAARWPKFFRSLLAGPSPEAAVVARLAAADARSTTARNNKYICDITGFSAWSATTAQVREGLRQQEAVMTAAEQETAAWLTSALEDRARLHYAGQDTTQLSTRINLASSS